MLVPSSICLPKFLMMLLMMTMRMIPSFWKQNRNVLKENLIWAAPQIFKKRKKGKLSR